MQSANDKQPPPSKQEGKNTSGGKSSAQSIQQMREVLNRIDERGALRDKRQEQNLASPKGAPFNPLDPLKHTGLSAGMKAMGGK